MNKDRSYLLIAAQFCAVLLCTVFVTVSAPAQVPNKSRGQGSAAKARSAFPWPLMPGALALTPASGPTLPVGAGIFAQGGEGRNGALTGFAGFFQGRVQVTGNLVKGGGAFKIDHPLDPENKYLYHSFVESPDMKNIYDGVATLDASGEATVQLPEWFGALNKDFRYLLTSIGAPSPALYIAEEISDNHFKIAGGKPGTKVSWLVTGIRQDAYANKHRIPVEEAKPEGERGTYLHPDAFNQPEERNVLFVHHPQLIKRERVLREGATGRQK